MNDHAPFLATILERPDDDGPRLVYADWLEEQGESERAEFIRVQCEAASWGLCPGSPHGPPGSPPTPGCECAYRGDVKRRGRELLGSRAPEWMALLPGFRTFYHIFKDHPDEGGWSPNAGPATRETCVMARFRRGFVEFVTCPWPVWLAHHAALRAATPLRRVRLTTWPCVNANESLGQWRFRGDSVINGPFLPWRTLLDFPASSTDARGAARALLQVEFPGIEFELPASRCC